MYKLLKLLIFPLVLSLIVLQGCNKDDNPVDVPILTFISPNLADGIYTTDESGVVELTVTVDAPNGFNVLRISYEGINVDTQEIPRTEEGQTTLNFNYQLTDIVYGSSGSFTITFLAIDNRNFSSQVVLTIQPDLPTIELTTDNTSIQDGILNAEVGQTFNLRYRFTFPSGFGQFKTTLTYGSNTSETIINTLPPTQGLAVTDAITFAFDQSYLELDISYNLEITDILGNKADLTVPVSLIFPPALKYTAISLAAPTEDKTSKTFFSTNLGQTFSVEDVNTANEDISIGIDFGYYYSDTEGASLAGPANFPFSIYILGPNGENWQVLNVMNFKRTDLSESEFNGFNEDSQLAIDNAYDNATGDVKLVLTELQEGEIVAFKTDMKNNKRSTGLFKVLSITGTTGPDAKLELDIIVNQ